ncbi:MAG: c-type cytochrome [bacterium]
MNTKNKFNPSIDFYFLFLFSVVMFVLVLVSFYKQANPEWKKYQKQFKHYLSENVGSEIAQAFEMSVKQIWLPELSGVDRCISCHVGYDNPNLADAPQPFTAHPDIEPHSIPSMGCTICHGGQGFALKKKDAHGEIKHWEEPLFGKKLAEKYGFTENALLELKCNICHRRDEDTPGLKRINLAKKLITQKRNCRTCHRIDGVGGKTGPDLTFVGDKHAERFDFSNIKEKILTSGRPLSMLSWHFEHFKNPKAVVPDSKMPFSKYTDDEAWALALMMMSWKNINLPILLVPKEKKVEMPELVEVEREGRSLVDWGKQLFQDKFCADCHTIGGGVEVGPDLLGVTQKREKDWLRRMIRNPEVMEESDPITMELYKEYDEVGMVVEDLTDEEIEAIIEYLQSVGKK